MQPDPPAGPGPTYPPPPPPPPADWRTAEEWRPYFRQYPILADLLASAKGVLAVYAFAAVPKIEAEAYGLRTAGFTDGAIAEAINRDVRTVRALIDNAEDRILHALMYMRRPREEAG